MMMHTWGVNVAMGNLVGVSGAYLYYLDFIMQSAPGEGMIGVDIHIKAASLDD